MFSAFRNPAGAVFPDVGERVLDHTRTSPGAVGRQLAHRVEGEKRRHLDNHVNDTTFRPVYLTFNPSTDKQKRVDLNKPEYIAGLKNVYLEEYGVRDMTAADKKFVYRIDIKGMYAQELQEDDYHFITLHNYEADQGVKLAAFAEPFHRLLAVVAQEREASYSPKSITVTLTEEDGTLPNAQFYLKFLFEYETKIQDE